MTTETSEKGANTSETGGAESTDPFPSCGPGCDCGKPAGKGNVKVKIVICLAVAVAVIGILLFKTTNARQNSSGAGQSGFSTPFASTGTVANSAGQRGGSGAPLSAIAELNTVAAKLDTVFLVIPSKDNAPLKKETTAVLTSVEQTLNTKGLSTGIFILQTSSPDYADVAAKVTPPGVAVLTKGRGIGFASGEMSESKLMQAYVASTRGGGCCPPGGSTPAKPCN